MSQIPNCLYSGFISAPALWAALFRVCFGLAPAYREFASASALVFRVCFGLGPLSQLIASLHWPRPSYFGLDLLSLAPRPS